MFEQNQLTEEQLAQKCKCENCGFYPLAHFEKCPDCKSECYHEFNIRLEEKKLEVEE